MDHLRRHLVGQLLLTAVAPLATGAAAMAASGAAPEGPHPPELRQVWPQMRRVGLGTLRYFGLQVYEARLWAPGPIAPADWEKRPFALELIYARALDGAKIADRSLEEMRRQGEIADSDAERWLATLRTSLPDVQARDRLTGRYQPGAATQLIFNGVVRAEWPDEALSRRFFGIWLSARTSEPDLREALFGGRT
jgi:hypothetical protein